MRHLRQHESRMTKYATIYGSWQKITDDISISCHQPCKYNTAVLQSSDILDHDFFNPRRPRCVFRNSLRSRLLRRIKSERHILNEKLNPAKLAGGFPASGEKLEQQHETSV